MTPLKVSARLGGPIALPTGHLALDGLLAWSVAAREHLPPPVSAADCQVVEIPLERDPSRRFHLCSIGQFEVEAHEHRFVNRRFPLGEAQQMGGAKLRRVQLSTGPCKSYRLPLDTTWLVNDTITWWCVGEADEVRDLLALVGYLGKKRGVGLGRVRQWDVVEVLEPWEGFPVTRNGQPMRALPLDWEGLSSPPIAYATLTYPYWDHTKEVPCAVPR